MSEPTGFTRAKVEALSARLGEPDWVLERRLEAFERFEEVPYPLPTDEDWRRTDLSRIDFNKLSNLVEPNGHAAGEPLADWEAETAGYLAFSDGVLTQRQLDPELERAGVILTSLHEAIASHPELVRRWFMTECVEPDEGKFTLLHAAFWNAGTFLYVPPGVEVERPFLSSVNLSHGGGCALHHTLIVADDRSRVSVVEEFRGGGDDEALSAPVVETIALRAARLDYAAIQAWDGRVYEFASRRAQLHQEADVNFTVSTLGGKLSKSFVGALLSGQGASCKLLGLYFPEAGQHLDHTTLQDHRVPNCTSDLLFKGALDDRSRAVFRGVIRVHPEAQRTDAYQTNNNLLLGDGARADSMPVLEIEADDVKCSHGATLAHLDDEDLFYLRSRGLPRETAERMVISGFFEPVIEQIPLQGVRDRLHEMVARRIERKLGA